MSIIGKVIAWLSTVLQWQNTLADPNPEPQMESTSQKIYSVAKLSLDEHLTLNENVPSDVGCAEAVSFILEKVIPNVPSGGFAGTHDLWQWLKTAATAVDSPQAGDIIISPTGTSTRPNPAPHGHVGVVLKYGIGSNDSNSGLFRENYSSVESWRAIFTGKLGFPVYYYRFS